MMSAYSLGIGGYVWTSRSARMAAITCSFPMETP
jgi:hypothetical protein